MRGTSEPKRRRAEPAAAPQVARLGALYNEYSLAFFSTYYFFNSIFGFHSYTWTNFSAVMKEMWGEVTNLATGILNIKCKKSEEEEANSQKENNFKAQADLAETQTT
jgi:hypothetical protein